MNGLCKPNVQPSSASDRLAQNTATLTNYSNTDKLIKKALVIHTGCPAMDWMLTYVIMMSLRVSHNLYWPPFSFFLDREAHIISSRDCSRRKVFACHFFFFIHGWLFFHEALYHVQAMMNDFQEFYAEWVPAFTSLLTLSLFLFAQMVYFGRFTWVIILLEEHLRKQWGFSWGEQLKANLWVHVRAQKDSWLMKQDRI